MAKTSDKQSKGDLYNFSVIAEPLTNLLGRRVKFIWTDNCQKSFEKLKAILKSTPVLLAPSFDKEFKLVVDASDVGAGSVLLQEDDNGVDHPVCYYSKNVNKHQRNYSTIEKECLSHPCTSALPSLPSLFSCTYCHFQ